MNNNRFGINNLLEFDRPRGINERLGTVATTAGLSFLGYTALLALSRRWHRHWGATAEELERSLPGDEFAKGVASTHAITIDAPVEEVWRWLVQIGQDRGGFYSYTALENVVLLGMRNADTIHPEWQTLEVGDHVRLGSERVYKDKPLLKVLAVEPNHYLVLEHWGTFVLEPVSPAKTRMIIRTVDEIPGRAERLFDFYFTEPLHFIMERGMLRGIKKRAERNHLASASTEQTAAAGATTDTITSDTITSDTYKSDTVTSDTIAA